MSATLRMLAPPYLADPGPVTADAATIEVPVTGEGAHAENLTRLKRRLRSCCAHAVDPLEIAARMEADGINDAVAADRYGHPDVFSLAERLYTDTTRRPAAAPPIADVWQSRASHHLLRGLLFGLPGLLYVAASTARLTAVSATRGPGPLAAVRSGGLRAALGAFQAGPGIIVFSLLLAWGASEALSYLGYVRLGRGDPNGAQRVLRRGLVATLTLALPAIGGAGWALHIGLPAAAFAAGQTVYLLAATVVLVTGGERWLLAALCPGVAASLGYLASGAGGMPPYVWACAGATVLATGVLAYVRTRRSRWAKGRTVRVRDLVRAAPHTAFALLAGGLLTFGTLVTVVGAGGGNRASTLMALPLSMSMGAAEWLLFRYRRHAHRLLRTSTTLPGFSRRVRCSLLAVLAGYLTLLVAIADGVSWVGAATGSFQLTPLLISTSVVLGGALFTGLAMRSCGITGPVLGACAAALAGEAAAMCVARRLGHHLPPDLVQFAACTGLFVALLTCALVALGRATRHR